MIGYLRGIVLEKTPDTLILDVSGVGYEVTVPASSFCVLPRQREAASLFIHTHVREDAIRLFGFASLFDRRMFEMLLTVNSVGPKAAMSLLGPLDGEELCRAITAGSLETLVRIPGVGLKTAERLVLELKAKCQQLLGRKEEYGAALASTLESGAVSESAAPSELQPKSAAVMRSAATKEGAARVIEDLRSALLNLGYREKQVAEVMKEYESRSRDGAAIVLEEALREILKQLSGRLLAT
jgi:Holliday junction DNA helicase RuvA